MVEKSINKHYQLSSSLVEDLKQLSKGRFKNEVSAVEYYLKIGLRYQELKDMDSLITKDLNYCKNEIFYIKKLLEQLFSNKKFVCNRKINDDESLKDFKKSLYKSDYHD